MDLHPTLLELAGLDSPDHDGPHALDGISLRQHLLSRQRLHERTVFWRQGNSKAVRWRDWKLVSIHGRPFELYDLSDSLAERKDLSNEKPEITRRLTNALRVWESELVD